MECEQYTAIPLATPVLPNQFVSIEEIVPDYVKGLTRSVNGLAPPVFGVSSPDDGLVFRAFFKLIGEDNVYYQVPSTATKVLVCAFYIPAKRIEIKQEYSEAIERFDKQYCQVIDGLLKGKEIVPLESTKETFEGLNLIYHDKPVGIQDGNWRVLQGQTVYIFNPTYERREAVKQPAAMLFAFLKKHENISNIVNAIILAKKAEEAEEREKSALYEGANAIVKELRLKLPQEVLQLENLVN